jgi:hypoxanthine phosphoribosyltransferase
LKASSYQNSTQSSGKVIFELTHFDLSNYHVILVEDIVDTGNTVNEIAAYIQAQGVLSLKICSLLFKKEKYHKKLPIHYYGFLIDDQFVVGYGMDFAEEYRNLNYIGVYNV